MLRCFARTSSFFALMLASAFAFGAGGIFR